MSPVAIDVAWEIAADDRFANVVRRGRTAAIPEWAHSVHVEVDGLQPDHWYWYRFRAGDEWSPVGRTRTLPRAGVSVNRLRFSFLSCQHYEMGHFTAHRHLAAEDLDLVFHLGDYIYEGPATDNRPRRHDGPEIMTLADYRNRYALYRTDPDLQAAHAACPFIVTWDDHEVDNNYAGDISEHNDPVQAFLERRTAAYQAYWEHMPLRRSSLPHGDSMRIFRRFSYGSLASFFVLDTRQYRTDQPCGDGPQQPCRAVFDERATLLGAEQERWLFGGFSGSKTRWNVIPQQVMMAPVDRVDGPTRVFSMDQWGGYEANRTRLMKFLSLHRRSNPVVITGDVHSNFVNDLKIDFFDPRSPVIATELVGTSMTSGGDGADRLGDYDTVVSQNEYVKFYNGQRGYVTCDVTEHEMRADYRVVEYVSRPGAQCITRASFVVEDGRPGAQIDKRS